MGGSRGKPGKLQSNRIAKLVFKISWHESSESWRYSSSVEESGGGGRRRGGRSIDACLRAATKRQEIWQWRKRKQPPYLMVALFQTIVGCHRHMCPPPTPSYSALLHPTLCYLMAQWNISADKAQPSPATTEQRHSSNICSRYSHLFTIVL